MKKLLMIILICCGLIIQSRAEDTHIQLNDYSIGYINSSSTANPLTEAMANFAYLGNIAFPYSYRCIGVERSGNDASKEVNRMVIHLEKLTYGSLETGAEIPDDLEIYTSSDNVTYTLLASTSYVTALEILAGGDLELMVDGLSITQPYIKLRCVRTLSSYVFGSTDFQNMISLYTLNEELFGTQLFVSATTGYNNSSDTADPLTESMINFGYANSAAFPLGYRCIGIKKDDSVADQEVGRVLINLEKLVPGSIETGDEIVDDLELYVSNDNLTYRLIPNNYAVYMGRVANGMKILLDGLSIQEQYIKLRCVRTLSSYVFGTTAFQQIAKAIPASNEKQVSALVGFEDSYWFTSPLNESLSKWGYIFSIAFPWSYRSIGIRKDDSEAGLNINRIVINLKKLAVASSETGEEIPDDLNLYVSNDNITYSLVPKTYSIYFDPLSDGLRIVLDGLDISQKYVKIRCPRTASGYVFGNNCPFLLSAFRYTPSHVDTADFPRYTYGSTAFKVSAAGKQDETLKLSYVPSSGTAQNLWTQTISSDGTATYTGTANLQSLPAGKIKLRFEIFNVNNDLIDRKDLYVFNTTGLVSSNLAADNVAVIVPQSSNLTGIWGDMSMTTGIDRTVNYKQAQSSDAACSLNLPAAGWCAIYIGLVGGDSRAVVSGLETVSSTVKLEYWRTDIPPAVNAVGDAYIGCYNLTGGKTITIARKDSTTPLQLAHVIVRKLSQDGINIVTQSSSNAPRVIQHNDGYSGFYGGTLNSEATLQQAVGDYTNVPLYSYDWCIGTTTAFNINTTVGVSFGDTGFDLAVLATDPDNNIRAGDVLAGDIVQSLLNNNINPLSVICDKGDQQGTSTNVTLRMGEFFQPPLSYSHNGPILNDNDDYRQRNIDGTTYAWKLSYAYPEVQDYILNALEDALDSNVDGVHLQFLRTPPFFGYDQPIIREYINRYGPFTTSYYMNANWQQIQRDIMTDLVGDIYQMIQLKAPVGKTIKLKVSFDQQNYYRQGLDIAAWINAGWVDVISPGCYGVPAQTFDLSPFVDMVNGTSCKIFVHGESTLMGHDPTPEEESGEVTIERVNMSLNQFRKFFMDMHAQGADGIYPFNYNCGDLANAIEDMKENEIWLEFAEPFIDWFD